MRLIEDHEMSCLFWTLSGGAPWKVRSRIHSRLMDQALGEQVFGHLTPGPYDRALNLSVDFLVDDLARVSLTFRN